MLPEDLSKLRVVDLKKELTERGLATKGKKDELVARLQEWVDENKDQVAGQNDQQQQEEQPPQKAEESQPEPALTTNGKDSKENDSQQILSNEQQQQESSLMFDPIDIPQPHTIRAPSLLSSTLSSPITTTTPMVELPYSPPKDKKSLILIHRFERDNTDDNNSIMPVKYTAYNVLRTSLFLLTEEGRITVMDIETGKMIGTVDNVAAVPELIGPQRQVRGIDVNVVGGNEIVVTSRQGLLSGTMVNQSS